MRPYFVKPIKLEDCREHGPDSQAELFIVEGDSAAGAVTVLRNAGFQAVLPMQGKPLNALKATSARVHGNELYQRLSESLGLPLQDFEATQGLFDARQDDGQPQSIPTGNNSLNHLRFKRVLMLFDPDADGIHIGALMLMFFYRWMRPLLDGGHVEIVRAPLFALTWQESNQSTELSNTFAYSVAQARAVQAELKHRGIEVIESRHFRGLGSIEQALLAKTCVYPGTRKTQILSPQDAQAAITVFGGMPKH
jgi:DNA gyrase subunit B